MPSAAAQCEALCKKSCRDILKKSKSKAPLATCVDPCKASCLSSIQANEPADKPKPKPKPKPANKPKPKPKPADKPEPKPKPANKPLSSPPPITARTTPVAHDIQAFEYHQKDNPRGIDIGFLGYDTIKRRTQFGLPVSSKKWYAAADAKGESVDTLALLMRPVLLCITVSPTTLVAKVSINENRFNFTYDTKTDTLDLRTLNAADAAAVRQMWPKSRMRKFIMTAAKDMVHKSEMRKFEKQDEGYRGRDIKVTNLGSRLVDPSDPPAIQKATRDAAMREHGRIPPGRKSPPGHAGDFEEGTIARGIDGKLWISDGSRWKPHS